MAKKIVELELRQKGVKKAEKSFKSLGSSISRTSAIFGTIFASVAILGAARLAKMAAEAEGVRIAFDRLNKPDLLKNLQTATKNTVADIELMQRAITAQNFRISLEQLPILLKFASQRARETGESVDFLVNSIVIGIGRKSPLILDNLGLDALRVREKFKQTGDMAKAVGIIIEEEFARTGILGVTTADKFDQVTASFQNMGVAIGQLINNIGMAIGAFDFIIKAAKELSDSLQITFGTPTTQTYRDNLERLNREIKEFASEEQFLVEILKEQRKEMILLLAASERSDEIRKRSAKGLAFLIGDLKKQIKDMNVTSNKGSRERLELVEKLKKAQVDLNEIDKKGNEIKGDPAFLKFLVSLEKEKAAREQLIDFTFRYNEQIGRNIPEAIINTDLMTEATVRLKDTIEEITEASIEMSEVYADEVAVSIIGRNQLIANSFTGVFTQIFQGILTDSKITFKTVGNLFRDMLIQMAAQIAARASVFALLSIFGFGGLGGARQFILGFAHGGRPPVNQPSVVGEEGPELFVPDVAGTIIPNNQIGQSIVVNITGNVLTKDFVEDQVIPQIQTAIRRAV